MQPMRLCVLALACAQIALATTFFKETFDSSWADRWVQSTAKSDYGKFDVSAGKFYGDKEKDRGLQTTQDARFYAISAKFDKFSSKKVVIQFSVKHEQNIDCGGGYVKVLPDFDNKKFDGDSTYNVMFGPDICGATKKIHFIFSYKGKNLLWKKEPRAETDTLTHVYTAIINEDGTYEVLVDNEKRESGKLEEDWDFLKPKEIDDPTDKKPSDWVDEAEIDDPEDKKPEDWDNEPEKIVDPDATQPEDWDEEEDGKWEAPTISNPKFKGAWKAKKIPNPAYKGIWKPKQIANPEYEADDNLGSYDNWAVAGFDLWQVKSGTIFDNLIITDSVDEAKAFYEETNGKTKVAEKKAYDKLEADKAAKEEELRKQREAEDKKSSEEEEEEEEEDEDDKKDAKEGKDHDEL